MYVYVYHKNKMIKRKEKKEEKLQRRQKNSWNRLLAQTYKYFTLFFKRKKKNDWERKSFSTMNFPFSFFYGMDKFVM